MPDRNDWVDDEDGFPRPNWGALDGWMRVPVVESDLDEARQPRARYWRERLRSP